MAHTSATMSRNKEAESPLVDALGFCLICDSCQDVDRQAAEVDRVADLYGQSHANTKKAEDAYKARCASCHDRVAGVAQRSFLACLAIKAHLVALAIAKKRRDDLKQKADDDTQHRNRRCEALLYWLPQTSPQACSHC